MRVKSASIYNYKSICSEKKECKLDFDNDMTFLIGGNESGKTNILEALLKFSTGEFQEIDIPYVLESTIRSNVPDDLKMISVTFGIEAKDKKALSEIHPTLGKVDQIEITRTYKGEPSISSPELISESVLEEIINNINKLSKQITVDIKEYLKKYRRVNKGSGSTTWSLVQRLRVMNMQIDGLAKSFQINNIRTTLKKIVRVRRAIKALENPLPEFESNILKSMGNIEQMVNGLPEYIDARRASKAVCDFIPKFTLVPVNPNLWLEGRYLVDDILDESNNNESLISIRRLLTVSDLNLSVAKSLSPEMQSVELQRAAEKVTGLLRELWEQEPEIEIIFEWSPEEGNRELYVMIKTQGYRGFPQYRSLGFRWFLELYLLYVTAMNGNVLMLFEEPGIFLHPNAQNYLKRVMRDNVANYGQIVYSTHSPNMYDLAYPEGCRAVNKDRLLGVTTIGTNYDSKHQHATWAVAMQALGLSFPEIRMCNKNIIVEGAADWVYLITFAKLLVGETEELRDIVTGIIHICACQGTSSMPPIVPFFCQPGVASVVLLDSDDAGNQAKIKLENQFQIPNKYIKGIIMINDVLDEEELGSGEHELEDLFGSKYFGGIVSSYLGNDKLSAKGFKTNNKIANKALSQINSKSTKKIYKYDIAWHFNDLVKQQKTKVPVDVNERFKNLLVKLVSSIG